MPDRSSRIAGLLVSLLAAVAIPMTAGAQTIAVESGGTLEVANGGVWDLQGAPLDLGGPGSTASILENGGGRFAGGQLEATRALSSPSSADPAGLGIEISASEDLGDVTVTRGHAVQDAPNNNEGIARYYDILPSQNNSGLSAELTFTYSDAELNGIAESNLEFFKSEDGGTSWSEEGFDSRDTNANTVTLSGIEALSRWTLGSTQSPLPVELASFEAQVRKKKILLRWQTASETNNSGFAVQHQPKGKKTWERLGFVESKATGGTTTEAKRYRFDAEDLKVGTHRFRLKQADLSGASTLSDPVTVEIQMEEALRLSVPAPNPVRSVATLSFAVREATETRIALYNVLGQKVRTLYRDTPPAGEAQTIRIDAAGVPSGTYFLQLRAGDRTVTQRLTVVR